MSLGHVLKTVGQTDASIEAYRKSIALTPALGEAWWSLANLKTVRFTADDRDTIRQALAGEIGDEDRFHLQFALGKAEEDAGDYDASFAHYAEGNRLRRGVVDYDPEEMTAHVARSKAVFTPAWFGRIAGTGCPAPDPIFIVGMPRAGSTLIEQILSSHSLVEGTMELPDMPAIARRLGERKLRSEETRYPEAVLDLSVEERAALGAEYIERTRVQRKTDRPFFIDKMPNNFALVGLIRAILPNGSIIDARRHPLGCCFSNFKQHFARGQTFTYDLAELGRYYRDYVALMAHFDEAVPGAVHRVFYERMVQDTEAEVRRLLEYLGLGFESACLRFYESGRAVRTASSEQVRRPIFREGVEQWRHFERHLDPLKAALGSALSGYPHA
jgi:tetratricopeptide (TPR) repeat protein